MWNPFKKKQKPQKASPVAAPRSSVQNIEYNDSSVDLLQTVLLIEAFSDQRDTSPAPEVTSCHDSSPSYSAPSESSYSSGGDYSSSYGGDSGSCGGDSGGGGGGGGD